MTGLLQGKLAIITGASAGIGHAAARALARQGAAVVVQARRRERLAQLVDEIQRDGGRAWAIPGDASRPADIDGLIAAAMEHAGQIGASLDIVLVNAGRGLAGGLLSSDEGRWREMYELNVLGAALLMRRTGEIMVRQGHGDIVALGSASGHHISPFSGFYGSTKFALAGMVEAFRREVCGKGVRVTLVKPGIVTSEFQAIAGYTPQNFYESVARFGTLLDPMDVAQAIEFIVTRPPHVHVSDMIIRPRGQDYP